MALRCVGNSLDSTKSVAALISSFMKTTMFWILLTSSNIVRPILCFNLSFCSKCIERLLVFHFFVASAALKRKNSDRLPLPKSKESPDSSSSMTSTLKTGPVVNVTFLRSVFISEVCGSSSVVKESGEYRPN